MVPVVERCTHGAGGSDALLPPACLLGALYLAAPARLLVEGSAVDARDLGILGVPGQRVDGAVARPPGREHACPIHLRPIAEPLVARVRQGLAAARGSRLDEVPVPIL